MVYKLWVDVIFDTSYLWGPETSPYLISGHEKFVFLNSGLNSSEVAFQILLPRMVIMEREYQMRQGMSGGPPYHQEIQRLLNSKPELSEEDVPSIVSAKIARDMAQFLIQVIDLDPSRVDWRQMMENAAYRQIPFTDEIVKKKNGSPTTAEKGFRDAVIIETTAQYCEDALKDDPEKFVAFVSGDRAERTALETRMGSTGIRIYESIGSFIYDINQKLKVLIDEDTRNALLAAIEYLGNGRTSQFYHQFKLWDTLSSHYMQDNVVKNLYFTEQSNLRLEPDKIKIIDIYPSDVYSDTTKFIEREDRRFQCKAVIQIEGSDRFPKYRLREEEWEEISHTPRDVLNQRFAKPEEKEEITDPIALAATIEEDFYKDRYPDPVLVATFEILWSFDSSGPSDVSYQRIDTISLLDIEQL